MLHCSLYALLEYAHDGPKFTNGKVERLRKPTVHDLPIPLQPSLTNEYVEDVIVPSRKYFYYESAFSQDTDPGAGMVSLFLQIISFVMVLVTLFQHFTNPIYFVVSAVLAALCCGLIRRLIARFYLKHFSIEAFTLSEDDLRQSFAGHESEFPVGYTVAFNNYVIDEYLSYYHSISRSMERRIALASFIDKAAVVIYLLFFLRTPD